MTEAARLYGGSLYDLAMEEQMTEPLLSQLSEVRSLFRENPDYVSLLSEPSLPKEERRELIEKAFGGQAERYLVNFLKLLCDKGLLREFADCCEEFTRRYNADNHIAEAVVTSAVPLLEEQAEALQKKLSAISGKTVRLIRRTDPRLIAGIRVELEGKLLDGTAKSRLDGISRALNETMV